MDQSTHNVRRTSWLNILTECQQRPVNVSVKQWLADNGVKEKAYYYWLCKFRREACEQMQFPAASAPAEVSFAEFPIPVPAPVTPAAVNKTVAVISANGITLEISNGISEPLLCLLLKEVPGQYSNPVPVGWDHQLQICEQQSAGLYRQRVSD